MPPPPATPDPAPTKRPRGRPRKTAQERDDGNRRSALLHHAAQLFRRQGFAATTTRDIAAAAGMQSGSPFYFFKSKDALLLAVMETGIQIALQRQAHVCQHPEYARTPAAQQLRQHIHAHLEVLLDPNNDFVSVVLYEQRSLSHSQRKQLGQLITQYEALWLPSLHALHAQGQLGTSVPLARLLILGALNWSVQWYDATQASSIDRLADAALALFLRSPGAEGLP